jgi:Lhr-like helicase
LHRNWSGAIALHHGSIEMELRTWVEEALHEGKLKAVVCTASLDLGVDFRPVETVIQVGSPKGVARFLQRAGRSGHQSRCGKQNLFSAHPFAGAGRSRGAESRPLPKVY